MLPRSKFEGELSGKNIEDFSIQLDYSIKDVQERNNKLKEILYTNDFLDEYFEEFFLQDDKEVPHFKVVLNKQDSLSDKNNICNKLEQMANYLLFSDECLKENDLSDYSYLGGSGKSISRKREISFEELETKYDKYGNCLLDKNVTNNNNYKLKPRTTITLDDINNIKYIKELQEFIDLNKIKIDTVEEGYEKRKLSKLMKDLRKEQVDIKNGILQPIDFKSVLMDETHFDFDSDTGYYDDNGDYTFISENKIDLGNPLHVYKLISLYSELKQSCYDNLNSDTRYILEDLEDLIENSDLKDYEKDLIILKIDKVSAVEIINFVQQKYGLVWSEPYLTKVFSKVIPMKISKQYLRNYENWFYTVKAKGDYKTCPICGETKLANNHYFAKDMKNKDKLKNICKNCDKSR